MRGGTLQRGDQVSLRHMEGADEEAFLRAVRSSRKLHRPWSYLPETSEGFRDMLVRPLGESYLICRNEDGALAGSASLGHIVFGNLRSAYLGYSALVPHQGQGYMTEGLELVLRHAFGTFALHRVEVNVQPDNERSIALAERLLPGARSAVGSASRPGRRGTRPAPRTPPPRRGSGRRAS